MKIINEVKSLRNFEDDEENFVLAFSFIHRICIVRFFLFESSERKTLPKTLGV